MIADTTAIAAREGTPLVRFAEYVSKATANRYVNRFALYGNFESGSVRNSEQNDSRRDPDGTHLVLQLF